MKKFVERLPNLVSAQSALEDRDAWEPAEAWIPPKELLQIVHSATKCQVSKVSATTTTTLESLRTSRAGRFYINYIKPSPVLRTASMWFWRTLYPFYLNRVRGAFLSGETKKWRQLAGLGNYAKLLNLDVLPIFAAESVATPEPETFPLNDQSFLAAPHEKYEFPAIDITTLHNCVVNGGTNLTACGNDVIHHDMYDFTRDYTSEEMHHLHFIDRNKGRIRFLYRDVDPLLLDEAASFVDAISGNYAHWLTEVLPRIAVFCAQRRFAQIPIIVNDGLHPNIMASLALVAGTQRQVITLPAGRSAKVKTLYFVSPCGYIPFEFRDKSMTTWPMHGYFSPHAMRLMAAKVIASLPAPPPGTFPEKIYIRRNMSARNILNVTEVEDTLIAQGFVPVEPETMSFAMQAMVFRNARVIAGAAGAAMANLIFCTPGARIVIMGARSARVSFWYWQNIALAAGHSLRFVLGAVPKRDHDSIHPSYKISAATLKDAVQDNADA